MRIEDYTSRYSISEVRLRKWLEEDKQKTFGKIDTDMLEIQYNMECELEKTLVFKSNKIHIELTQGYDKDYLYRILEVLTK